MKHQVLEIRAMRRSWKARVLAIVTSFAFVSGAAAQAPLPSTGIVHHGKVSGKYHRSVRHGGIGVTYAHKFSRGHGTGFAELVGDPESGLGFYPLPMQYRIGAWRYHVRNWRPPSQNPVLFAMAADAARYNYFWATPAQAYRYGVYNPYDGVGTPYFAGYYGPAGDPDEPAFPFGRPYSR
jgi:hypothetical protein